MRAAMFAAAALADGADGERKRAVHVSFGGNALRLTGIYVQKRATAPDAGAADDTPRGDQPLVYSRVLDTDADATPAEGTAASAPTTTYL